MNLRARFFGFIAFLALSYFPAVFCRPAWADEQADPNAALVVELIAPVEVSADGKHFAPVSLGQYLLPGMSVRTGAGRLAFQLSDGSIVRLRPNTDLVIKANQMKEKTHNTVFRLLQGFARALVHKLQVGSAFEIETPNAVAAVKGTDFEIGYDGQNTEVKVFETNNPTGVNFTDLQSQQAEGLHADEKGLVGPDGLQPSQPLSLQDKQDTLKNYDGFKQGLGQPGNNGQAGPTNSNPPQDGPQEQPGLNLQDVAAINQSINNLSTNLDVNARQDGQTRQGDAFTGKVLVDRFGYRVQVSQYVNRPQNDPATVELTSISERTGGPAAGQSLLNEKVTYNQALPFDWASVVFMNLNDSNNWNPQGGTPGTSQPGYPIYWRTAEYFRVQSPVGDNILSTITYDAPSFVGSVYQGNARQGLKESILVNGNLRAFLDYHDPGLGTSMVNGAPYYVGYGVQASATSDQLSLSVYQLPDLGIQFSWYNNTRNALVFNETVYLSDDLGKVYDPYQVIPSLSLSDPNSLLLSGQSQYNFNLIFDSPDFSGRNIDLFVVPQMPAMPQFGVPASKPLSAS